MKINLPSPIHAPDCVQILQDNKWQDIKKTDGGWQKNDISLRLAETGTAHRINAVQVLLRAPQTPVTRLRFRWRIQIPDGVRILGDHWERGYGDLEWRGICPDEPLPWYAMIYNGNQSSGIGVRTAPAAFCCWFIDQQGITLECDLRNGGAGVLLGEREIAIAAIISMNGEKGVSPFAFARKFTAALCPNPILPPSPVYGANDWYYAYGKNTAERLLADSEFTAELAENLENRPFSVIDAGWQAGIITEGADWTMSNERFPDMAGLADAIRKRGCRPGIWFRPLLTTPGLFPENRMLKPNRFPASKEGNHNIIDPSIPENLESIREYMRCFTRQWRFELVKHDFSSVDISGRWGFDMNREITDDNWHFADRSKTTAEIVLDLYKAILDAAGNAMIIGCNTFSHLAAGLTHIQRTGDDTSGREWTRTRKMGVNTVAFRSLQHNNFYAADGDCLGLTTNIPWELNRQWLDLLANSGTPLFVSVEREAVGREQRRALRDAFSLAATEQVPGEALDWLDTTCPCQWRFGKQKKSYDWSEF